MNEKGQFEYSSIPKPVQPNVFSSKANYTSKKLSQTHRTITPNIMHDRRIPRGSVFAKHGFAVIDVAQNSLNTKGFASSKGSNQKKKKRTYTQSATKLPANKFSTISLAPYLVEQESKTPRQDVSNQTDEFIHAIRSSNRRSTLNGLVYHPKYGVDTSTQVEVEDGLFKFDKAVEPMLEILISKTLAQACKEVLEEYEIRMLEQEHKKLNEEKVKEQAAEVKEEIQAKEQLQRTKDIRNQRIQMLEQKQTMEQLTQKGTLYDPLKKDAQKWLSTNALHLVNLSIQSRSQATSLLDDLIFSSLHKNSLLSLLPSHDDEAMVRILLKEPIILANVNDNTTQELTSIGPLSLSRTDSLNDIEQKVKAWISENYSNGCSLPWNDILSILKHSI